MALFTLVYDDSLNRKRYVAYPGFKDTLIVNSVQGAVNFPFSGVTLTATHALDVYLDGRMNDETTHYTRDVTNNRVVFTAGVNSGSTVRLRLYLK